MRVHGVTTTASSARLADDDDTIHRELADLGAGVPPPHEALRRPPQRPGAGAKISLAERRGRDPRRPGGRQTPPTGLARPRLPPAPRATLAAVKRSVQVEIAGQQLTIRSDEGADYVQQLAEYVDAHLRVLSGGRRITNSAGVQRVALLVAMQLADELFREKDLHQRFRRRVGDRLETLRRALDDHEQRLAALHEQPPGPAAP
ncbi:MAG: cell division protein ZapA [Myxococcales bacterium]|nr:cell division protein ZapA [Myxococcales bacterium]